MKHLFLILFLFQSAIVFSQNNNQIINQNKKESGYTGAIEMGFLYGKTINLFSYQNTNPSSSFQVFNGYRFNRFLAAGITVALDNYDYMTVIPVSLSLRGELLKSRISPIYSLDLGYAADSYANNLGNNAKVEGKFMFNPNLGIRVNTGNSTALTFTVGYKMQKASFSENWWNGTIDRKITYNRLALKMGFMF